MPAPRSFDYAVLRIVPRVEREEFINAGVIVWCPELDWLGARVALDPARLAALWPAADVATLEEHLAAVTRIAAGGDDAGPIGKLTRRERFRWLVAPRSTMLQVSPVHTGLCDDPELVIERLMDQMVREPRDDAR